MSPHLYDFLRVTVVQGIFVGYRGYDANGLFPLFPFGHGLSYTIFEYSGLRISEESGGTFTVVFTIKNTGQVPSREVVQIYISDVESSLCRPPKELKGFTKVGPLDPGQRKLVQIPLDREALGFYHPEKQQWIAEEGSFQVWVGASSRDLRLKGTFELEKSVPWTGL